MKGKTPPASSTSHAVTGAMVLTSAQCIQIIKENGIKKQREEEEMTPKTDRVAKKK